MADTKGVVVEDLSLDSERRAKALEAAKEAIVAARQNKSVEAIRELIKEYEAPVIVGALEDLDTEFTAFFIKALPSEHVGSWFNYLSAIKQEELIANLPNPEVQRVIEDLYSDDLIDVIEELPAELVHKILSLSSSETRKTVNALLSYQDGEAGSVMSTDFIALNDNQTVKQALGVIRDAHNDYTDHDVYYVVNNAGELVGKTNLRQLAFEKNQARRLRSIMEKSLSYVTTKEDVEEIAKIFNQYDKQAIPVVTGDKKMVGIITDNDIIDIVIEETTEDINKMAGIGELRHSYLKASIWSLVKSRVFWLSILMVSATLSSIVIDQFTALGQGLTAGLSTALLIPIMTVISGASGNAGSQASVSVIRGLTIGEIHQRQYWAVVGKEVRVASLLGLILAVINMARLAIFFAIFNPSDNISQYHSGTLTLEPYSLAMVVSAASSASLFIAIVLSKVVGGALPLLAVRMKIDPAVMAAPILTTLVDALSTAIFFAIGIGIIIATL